MSKVERKMCMFDGGSELDTVHEDIQKGFEVDASILEALQEAEERGENWKRPDFKLRDLRGNLLDPEQPVVARPSVYSQRLDAFSVARTPAYRRLPTLLEETVTSSDNGDAPPSVECKVLLTPESSAAVWEHDLGEDARALASEILVHICGESCFKYFGDKVQQICRHGHYYVTEFAEWRRRRRGKLLRNTFVVVEQTQYGMQGRLLSFQGHPFECQSNYGGLATIRCSYDVQDLRRVSAIRRQVDGSDELYWMKPGTQLPHIGDREEWGYMNEQEWDGTEFKLRHPRPSAETPPERWENEVNSERWRRIFLECIDSSDRKSCSEDVASEEPDSAETDFDADDFDVAGFTCEARAAFSDGLNTGFYITQYTTKQNPTLREFWNRCAPVSSEWLRAESSGAGSSTRSSREVSLMAESTASRRKRNEFSKASRVSGKHLTC